MEGFAVGIDLGGTKIEYALVDDQGKVLKHSRHATDIAGGYPAILMQVIEHVRELTYDTYGPIWGIGVGVAGQVDASTGMVVSAGNLKWKNAPIKKDLEEVFSLPVSVTNDVRAATWGEWQYGAGRYINDLACLFIGTGIGGGVVCNGAMLNGSNNIAGEIGHLIIDMNGPPCTCGNYGCLEAFAGGWAIAKHAKDQVRQDAEKGKYLLELVEGQVEAITAYHVIQAFNDNDPLGVGVIKEAGRALITGVAGLTNVMNPQRIILGGGVIEGCPELLNIVADGVRKKYLRVATQAVEIVKPQLHNFAGVIGAASLIIYNR